MDKLTVEECEASIELLQKTCGVYSRQDQIKHLQQLLDTMRENERLREALAAAGNMLEAENVDHTNTSCMMVANVDYCHECAQKRKVMADYATKTSEAK